MLDVRLRAFLLALYFAINGVAIRGQSTAVHLTGRVSAIAEEADEGRFQIIGDSGSLTLDVSAWDYMIDYLRANNGREITVTLAPK